MKPSDIELLAIKKRLQFLDPIDNPPPGGEPVSPPKGRKAKVLDEAYFEQLHSKIMAEIEETEIEPPGPFNAQVIVLNRYWRKYSRPVARVTMSMTFALIGIGYLVTQLTQETSAFEKQSTLVKESVSRPEEFSASVLNSQNELDFMSDVATHAQGSISSKDLL